MDHVGDAFQCVVHVGPNGHVSPDYLKAFPIRKDAVMAEGPDGSTGQFVAIENAVNKGLADLAGCAGH